MKKITDAVTNIIQTDPRILDALNMGIINYKALARLIKPEVEELAAKPASIEAIAIAAQRLTTKITTNKSTQPSYSHILAKTQIQLRDDVHVFYLKELPQLPTIDRGFLVAIKGIDSATILVDDNHFHKLRIPEHEVVSDKRKLSAIILQSPPEISETPGVIAHLLRALAGAQVNVVEIISSYDTTYFLVEQTDSLRALEALRFIIRPLQTRI
ncbi:ACT domain protein [uncultured archaeon]|nr:ACT domain protein [uncultured archaeon]